MKTKLAENIDEYISGFPKNVQAVLNEVRATIKKEIPGAAEAIKYAIPTFVLKGNVISFAGYKKHVGLYPAPTGDEAFEKEIAGYRSGKSTLQFPLDEPIPFNVIAQIVQLRLEGMSKKQKS